jgi:hypothetical protein
MAQQNRIWVAVPGFGEYLIHGQACGIGVQEPHFVSGIEEGAAESQQAEWREMFSWNAAADGGVGGIYQENSHNDGPFVRDREFESLALHGRVLCTTKYI